DPSGLDPDPWGNTSITTSSSGDDSGVVFAGLVGFGFGVWNYYTAHTALGTNYFPDFRHNQAQLNTFSDTYVNTQDRLTAKAQQREPTNRFSEHNDDDDGFVLDLVIPQSSGAIHGACDPFAGDRETGGADTGMAAGGGHFIIPHSHEPHHV